MLEGNAAWAFAIYLSIIYRKLIVRYLSYQSQFVSARLLLFSGSLHQTI